MATVTISPAEQIANVQAALLRFSRRIHEHGLTMRQARRLVERQRTHRIGRAREMRDLNRLADCWAAVSALDHWRELKARHAAGELAPLVTDTEMPF